MNLTCLCFSFSAAAAAFAGTVATMNYGGYNQSAVCAEHPMAEGAHYVEMTLLERGSYGAYMGKDLQTVFLTNHCLLWLLAHFT